MHFAYPARKTSNPPQYNPRSSKFPTLRRNHIRLIAVIGAAVLTLVWLVSRLSGGSSPYVEHVPLGKPTVVVVTALDEKAYPSSYIELVRENRIQYAQKHGYETFFPKVGDYDLKGAPKSWTKVVAVRHAMTEFPEAKYIWYLEQDAFVMNPHLKIEEHIMKPARLESMMIKDHPVVPPDSIIKTFGHLKGQDVDFVLSQDKDGLSPGSFVLRNGEWAKFFIETWFDPIYRSYNFQKAEVHALEHIVQWHPTILSKLSLIPQRTLNSYSKSDNGDAYKDGDIAVRFPDCAKKDPKDCETESSKFAQQWRTFFKNA